jgi:hypothetical protein
MKNEYLLISDGSSDRALIPIIDYFLYEISGIHFNGKRAEFGLLRNPPKSLKNRIIKALDLYPDIELIFIHRDAERQTIEMRVGEINENIDKASMVLKEEFSFVKIIPIRMTETWLLIEENAIKRASGNPNSKINLKLPSINKLEQIPNPKALLIDLIKQSSSLSGRRLASLNIHHCISLIPQFIDDFSPLLKLSSIKVLKEQIEEYQ